MGWKQSLPAMGIIAGTVIVCSTVMRGVNWVTTGKGYKKFVGDDFQRMCEARDRRLSGGYFWGEYTQNDGGISAE